MPTREQIEGMLESDPDDVFLNYALACLQSTSGEVETALDTFDRVIALDANYVAAYFQKGQALARSGNPSSARKALNAGIEVARAVGDSHAEGEMTEFLTTLPND